MPIALSLAHFQASVAQCDGLIASAHAILPGGAYHFSERDREQITVAAFLNMFIAWEEFLESSVSDYMMGDQTISGTSPTRYVVPPSREHSVKMVIHMGKYFDFSNHESVKRLSKLYFGAGNPFEVPISSMALELSDLKTMRNACAHLSSTTTASLEALSRRIFGTPQTGISVYQMLTMDDPRTNPRGTVYASYRDKLLVAAALVARG